MRLFIIKKIKKIFIFFLILFIFIELISFILSKNSILLTSYTPKLYLNKNFISLNEWWTEEQKWGSWHRINKSTEHKKSCFSSIYTSNEIGARDSTFKDVMHQNDNIILLGDSFAEGYGVNYEETSQYLLEKKIKKNILNFGVSNDFGPLQYWIIYEHFSNKYNHDTVIIYFLPSNDFEDNDFVSNNSNRHRPYYIKKGNDFDYFIPQNSIKNSHNKQSYLKSFVIDNLWLSNLLRVYKIFYLRLKNKQTNNYSGYFDSNIDQQKAVIHFLDKIIESDETKSFYLVSIPRHNDIIKSKEKNLNKVYWHNYFVNKSNKQINFKFIDLLEYVPENYKKLFFKCDGHWSAEGNEWVSEIMSKQIIK